MSNGCVIIFNEVMTIMKTVSEMAKELNVSVQTVYRTLNKVKRDGIDSLTEVKNNITYITSDGEQILTERFTPATQCIEHELNNADQLLNAVKQELNDEIIYLREQNKAFQDELRVERDHSRQQADRIAGLAEQIAELTRNQQVLFGMEQQKTLPIVSSTPSKDGGIDDVGEDSPMENSDAAKKGFFKKIFGKR